jgi:hypothetical protein
MNEKQNHRCTLCGNAMRQVHVNESGSWCLNCEPYRPGADIHPAIKPMAAERMMTRAMVEFLKAAIFVFLGYGWAATAYGVFPIR